MRHNDGLLANLSDDVVGDPTGILRDRGAIRQRYQTLFQDLQEESIIPIRRLYGDGFVVDEAMWKRKAIGHFLGIEGRVGRWSSGCSTSVRSPAGSSRPSRCGWMWARRCSS